MGLLCSSAPQAYLLKNDENKALKPAELQKELNNMLKFNPDFVEAVSSCSRCPSLMERRRLAHCRSDVPCLLSTT